MCLSCQHRFVFDHRPSRVQKNDQPSSGCQIFIIYSPLLRLSKLAKVSELYIGYVLEALSVNGLYLSQSMSHSTKTLLKLHCRYKFQTFLKYDIKSKTVLRLRAVEPGIFLDSEAEQYPMYLLYLWCQNIH